MTAYIKQSKPVQGMFDVAASIWYIFVSVNP